ncbi:MAG: hypothetical protein GWP08_00615 [Nitrospiraceae bacterium]|nr:hypothetical protein [Nitrospiraceae bacterium]
MNDRLLWGSMALLLLIVCMGPVWAQDEAPATAPAAADEAQKVTLMTMIRWGGVILWTTMALGFFAFVLAVFCLLTVTVKREIPPNFVRRALNQIRAGDLRGAYQLCEGRDELLAHVIRSGLKVSGHDRYVIQDAMESEGERGVTALWQRISYLNNIGVIAPLMGLLGTVWGMVLAFNSIASDNAQVRGIAVAENVSKAMITTVGGLVVAIPSLVVYYYLRGRVIKIIAAIEAQASEVVELLARGHDG